MWAQPARTLGACILLALALGTPWLWLRAAEGGSIVAAAAAATPQPISEKIRQKQALIEATHRRLEASRHKLHAARFKEQSIADQLSAVQSSIARVRDTLGGLALSIAQNEHKLA